MQAARAAKDVAVAEQHLVVGDVVQLVVHVADGIEMDARGDQRHHAEHDDGERVDVVADRDPQRPELAQRVVLTGIGRTGGVVRIVRFGIPFGRVRFRRSMRTFLL